MPALAAALAARADRVLPGGFRAKSVGTVVSLSTPTEEALRGRLTLGYRYSNRSVIELEPIDVPALG